MVLYSVYRVNDLAVEIKLWKKNSEKGDVVFDTTRQNNHRTPDHGKEEKGGALPHSILETSADPESLLAIARFKNNGP